MLFSIQVLWTSLEHVRNVFAMFIYRVLKFFHYVSLLHHVPFRIISTFLLKLVLFGLDKIFPPNFSKDVKSEENSVLVLTLSYIYIMHFCKMFFFFGEMQVCLFIAQVITSLNGFNKNVTMFLYQSRFFMFVYKASERIGKLKE